jgi:hypothetical protein
MTNNEFIQLSHDESRWDDFLNSPDHTKVLYDLRWQFYSDSALVEGININFIIFLFKNNRKLDKDGIDFIKSFRQNCSIEQFNAMFMSKVFGEVKGTKKLKEFYSTLPYNAGKKLYDENIIKVMMDGVEQYLNFYPKSGPQDSFDTYPYEFYSNAFIKLKSFGYDERFHTILRNMGDTFKKYGEAGHIFSYFTDYINKLPPSEVEKIINDYDFFKELEEKYGRYGFREDSILDVVLPNITPDIIDKHYDFFIDKIREERMFNALSISTHLTKEFITKHIDKFDFEKLSRFLDKDMVNEFKEYISYNIIYSKKIIFDREMIDFVYEILQKEDTSILLANFYSSAIFDTDAVNHFIEKYAPLISPKHFSKIDWDVQFLTKESVEKLKKYNLEYEPTVDNKSSLRKIFNKDSFNFKYFNAIIKELDKDSLVKFLNKFEDTYDYIYRYNRDVYNFIVDRINKLKKLGVI